MRDTKLLDDEIVNGFSCYHLQGSTLKPDDKEAWISKDDYIVRRLKAKTEVDEREAKAQYAMMMTQMKALPPEVEKLMQDLGVKKAGMPIDMPSISIGSQKYYHEYNYRQVSISGSLSDDLFSYDPLGLPKVGTWSTECQ